MEREATGNVSKRVHHLIDYWTTDRRATVCETGQRSVWFGDVQFRSSTGDCAVSIPVHLVHLVLHFVFCSGWMLDVLVMGGMGSPEHWWMILRNEPGEIICFWMWLMVINSHTNNGLNWKTNTEATYKKGMSRLSLLWRLRSFSVHSKMMEMFYNLPLVTPTDWSLALWSGANWTVVKLWWRGSHRTAALTARQQSSSPLQTELHCHRDRYSYHNKSVWQRIIWQAVLLLKKKKYQ